MKKHRWLQKAASTVLSAMLCLSTLTLSANASGQEKYNMPVWQYGLIAFVVLLAAGLTFWGWRAIRGAKKRREEMGYIRICEGTDNENTDE